MDTDTPTLWKRLRNQILPPVPNFYARLCRQCEMAAGGIDELVSYMETGRDPHADRVAELERRGEALKNENMATLHQAFSTPIDREDIYQSIAALAEILNYARTTVREMQLLAVRPDRHTLGMARQLAAGVAELQRGFDQLEKQPLAAEAHADNARATEREVENSYRAAVAELFDASHYRRTQTGADNPEAASLNVLLQPLPDDQSPAIAAALGFVVDILKRREIYRHMSNAADRLVRAGEVLHDIVAKIA
ncbi:DUF47 domain-containing protein [Solimonas terrae]|uniref:DUF47 family protein n=1 Tax=Solimonas terrae TaxID=1396819 RepID=A0A6M2BNW0_9GAMM|nr:DUF47 family protein [Solimonas terrae]NGY03737.1 DUF47 family protein [Solimonas terrae]